MSKYLFVLLSVIASFMTGGQCLANTSPTDAYLDIHKKELAAQSYADILPLRSKSSIAKDKPMSEEEQKMVFPLFKATLPQRVTVTQEKIDGNKATLLVTASPSDDLKPGDKETTTGTIQMILEDGQWKLDTEQWNSHLEIH